ncbi:unnamed protein product [Brassica oleracea]
MLNITVMTFLFGLMKIHQTLVGATHLPFDEDILHSGTTVHTSTDRRTMVNQLDKTRAVLILQTIYSFPARFYDAIAKKKKN